MASFPEEDQEGKATVVTTSAFDAQTAQGRPGGLFQACMTAIRTAHFRSNRVRAVVVVAGLFTDRKIYRDVISIFYAVTKELEAKLQQLASAVPKEGEGGGGGGDDQNILICQKLLALGYRFTELYEKDLAYLYGSSSSSSSSSDGDNVVCVWQDQVEALVVGTAAAAAYRDKVRAMTTGAQLAGAALVLWGALIVGGGAVAMPRVKASYGVQATHLFQDVTGPGREARKREFVRTWDSLVPGLEAEEDKHQFGEIVRLSQECMQCNNNVLMSLARNPWWISPLVVLSGAVAVASVVGAMLLVQQRKESVKTY